MDKTEEYWHADILRYINWAVITLHSDLSGTGMVAQPNTS